MITAVLAVQRGEKSEEGGEGGEGVELIQNDGTSLKQMLGPAAYTDAAARGGWAILGVLLLIRYQANTGLVSPIPNTF